MAPGAQGLSLRRKLVCRMRAGITRWSGPVDRWVPLRLYLGWSRTVLAVCQALAWSQGRLGRWMDRLLPG